MVRAQHGVPSDDDGRIPTAELAVPRPEHHTRLTVRRDGGHQSNPGRSTVTSIRSSTGFQPLKWRLGEHRSMASSLSQRLIRVLVRQPGACSRIQALAYRLTGMM